jgi:zinc transport system substrate-binding protein
MKRLPIILLLLGLVLIPFFSGCSAPAEARLKVVASTSLITQIVDRVGGGRVEAVNIIPPAQCPGHFDVKPGDVQRLADAELFLLHGWQGEQFTDELIASANNADLTVIQLNVKVGENANWMTPAVQTAAVDKITEALCQVDGANSEAYRASAATYKEKITGKEAEIKEKLAAADPSSINVLCADQQAGFVGWAGFNIIDIYGRPETLTPSVVKGLVDEGKSGNVVLVIDNMQSGMDAGAGMAEELGCNRVILSNFPGGYDNTDTWEDTIEYNTELLLQAVGK